MPEIDFSAGVGQRAGAYLNYNSFAVPDNTVHGVMSAPVTSVFLLPGFGRSHVVSLDAAGKAAPSVLYQICGPFLRALLRIHDCPEPGSVPNPRPISPRSPWELNFF